MLLLKQAYIVTGESEGQQYGDNQFICQLEQLVPVGGLVFGLSERLGGVPHDGGRILAWRLFGPLKVTTTDLSAYTAPALGRVEVRSLLFERWAQWQDGENESLTGWRRVQ